MAGRDETIEECGRLRFDLERSYRYCHAKCANWGTAAFLFAWLNLGGLCFAASTLFCDTPRWLSVPAFVCSFVATGFSMLCRPEERIRELLSDAADYLRLSERLPLSNLDADEEVVRGVKAEKKALNGKERNVIPCLSVRCHNDVCRANGMDGETHPLSFVQSTLGQVCRFVPYRERDA